MSFLAWKTGDHKVSPNLEDNGSRVRVGTGQALARGPDEFDYTQPSIYERNILCADCDNELSRPKMFLHGRFEPCGEMPR